MNLHQRIAAALFAGLNHRALQAIELGFTGVDHTALGSQRNEISHTQFGKFFNKEIGSVAFRQRGGQFETKWQFTLGSKNLDNIQFHLISLDRLDFGDILPAVAVEQDDAIAVAKAANRGKMVSFGTLEKCFSMV